MGLGRLIGHALSMPPRAALAKGWRWGRRMALGRVRGWAARTRDPYPQTPERPGLARILSPVDPKLLTPHADALNWFADRWLRHEFDLLGSGWTLVERAAPPVLPIGARTRSEEISRFLDGDWRPIDWAADFRSGFRWPSDRLGKALAYGHEPGVDVKVPWELARMQHLPQLAWAFVLGREEAVREVRAVILDFLAANPPGFGINWMSGMDVAIRMANILVAVDILRAHGAARDDAFLGEVEAAALAHGRFVMASLDDHPVHRANHYLAEVAGLLFIAAYLPPGEERDRWDAFASQEITAEVERQFGPDGAGFEASTAYHRLSAETAVYAAALLARRGALPEAVRARLERTAEFSLHATKPNGRVVQIGDNDSGRFFKLAPVAEPMNGGWKEVFLDHRHLAGAVAGLFERPDLTAFAGSGLETAIVCDLAQGAQTSAIEPMTALGRVVGGGEAREFSGREIVVALPDPSVLDDIELFAYPDFGLYGWRGARLFLSVRCGPIGQNGLGAHAHHDQLAVELNVDGQDWIADPGCPAYTGDPATRDAYRSVLAHAAPRMGEREPARRPMGLFALDDAARARCLCFDGEGFIGVHNGFGEPVYRRVTVGDGEVRILDGPGAGETVTVHDAEALGALFPVKVAFSPGYGEGG